MRFKPNSTVATIIKKDDRYLFVEELDHGATVYNQPAGHLEQSEGLVQAAIRETLEETGCQVEITGYLGLYTYTAPSNQLTYHRHCFVGQFISHDSNQALDDGILGIKWLTLDELIESGKARSPLVIKCVQDHENRDALPLDVIYEHPNE